MKLQRNLRGKSNPKNQLPASQILEAETKKMEEKLSILKEMMNKVAEKREQEGKVQTRWATATDKKPLKNYAKVVLEEKSRLQAKNPQKFAKTGNFSEKAILKPQTSQNSRNPNELSCFLQKNNLSQYYEAFVSKGFEEIEILQEITTEMLNEMKIPPGHQIKLMKALKKDAKIAETNENSRKISSSCVPKRTDLVELPFEQPETTENQGKSAKAATKSLKKVNFNEKIASFTENKGDFKENARENPRTTTKTSCVDEGTGTSPRNFSGETKKPLKLSCWNCFKLFEKSEFFEYAKNFCSGTCKDAFLQGNELICAKCARKSLKTLGIYRNNEFFCNEKCAPDLQELQKRWNFEAKTEIIEKSREFFEENGENDEENGKDIEEIAEKCRENVDLFEDLKSLGGKSAKNEPVFLSLREIEEKYLKK